MNTLPNRLAIPILSIWFSVLAQPLLAQIDVFGPAPYLELADQPEGFCEECVVEDFEDNEVDEFLALDCGEILGPNIQDPRIPGVQITDSVDGDDGLIDGNGNGGHSYFCVDPATSVTITFDEPVVAAGVVWTDGDRGVSVALEAFDDQQNSLGRLEGSGFADSRYFGETAEDRFLGVRSLTGISSIEISNIGRGAGIEIDHVSWDTAAFGEPTELPSIDELCGAVQNGGSLMRFDLNSDGAIDAGDVAWFIEAMGTVPGDSDLDGDVDFGDFTQMSDAFESAGSFHQGDTNCDGRINFTDFLSLSENFGFEAGVSANAVPEPTSASMLLVSVISAALLCRRK